MSVKAKTLLILALAASILAAASPGIAQLPGMQAYPLLNVSPIGTPVSLGGVTGSASSSSVSLTTTASSPTGALLLACIQVGFGTTNSVTAVSDGTNSYSIARTAGYGPSSQSLVVLWSKANAASVSSGATLTATFSAASSGGSNVPIMVAAYVPGISTSPLDKVNSTNYEPSGGGATMSSGTTGTLTTSNQLAIGCLGFYNAATTITEGPSFTQIVNQAQGGGNQWRAKLAYQIVSSTSALNYQPQTTASVYGGSIISTFKGF